MEKDWILLSRRQVLSLFPAGILSVMISSCDSLKFLGMGATPQPETNAGWQKYQNNPVLGGDLGVVFDVALLREGSLYRMWFSWRTKGSIALVESSDGIHWSQPVIVLKPYPDSHWEDDVNRPVVIKNGNGYHMWYTGQANGKSYIGYVVSIDGVNWQRIRQDPVLFPDEKWEGMNVMCPDVIYEEHSQLFRMWYSAGESYEPNAIGYATSFDGVHWEKFKTNPIFQAEPGNDWEKDRVTASQVIPVSDWFYMFYIGFQDVNTAQIGLARSRDGIQNWQRHPNNPIIYRGVKEEWDSSAAYKPFAIYDGQRWLLWYNGRNGKIEQIGLAIHDGQDLGF